MLLLLLIDGDRVKFSARRDSRRDSRRAVEGELKLRNLYGVNTKRSRL